MKPGDLYIVTRHLTVFDDRCAEIYPMPAESLCMYLHGGRLHSAQKDTLSIESAHVLYNGGIYWLAEAVFLLHTRALI